jgi:type I restriction enzyme S subunit
MWFPIHIFYMSFTDYGSIQGVIDKRKVQLHELDELIKARFVELFGDPKTNPKGFVKAPMGEYMTLLTDFSSNGSYKTLDSGVTMYDEPNYAWMVRTTDLEFRDMSLIKYIDEKAYELLSKSKIFGGEIIMNKIGSAGKIYLMPKIDMPASLGRNAFMFRYNDSINVKYLYHLLVSEYGQHEIQQYVRGAVTKTITKDDARAVMILVPPIELQNEFEQIVEQVDKSKVIVQKSLTETKKLFDSLMQQYFA